MKNTFKKMVAMMSTMMITFGCFINKMNAADAEAAEASSVSASTTIDADEIAEEMVVKFNEARAELGLEPLYITPYLNEVAEVRAEEIAETNESYSHTRPDGTPFVTAIDRNLIDCTNAGEVLLRGSANVDTIFNAWKNSPGHWAIITKPEATNIGIRAHFDPDSPKRWYWAAEIVVVPDGHEAEDQRLPITKEENSENQKVFSTDDANDQTSAPEETIVYGDINDDGIVDSFDFILITRYINGKVEFTEAQLAAADILTDGFVTDLDAAILKMYLLGQIDEFPNI